MVKLFKLYSIYNMQGTYRTGLTPRNIKALQSTYREKGYDYLVAGIFEYYNYAVNHTPFSNLLSGLGENTFHVAHCFVGHFNNLFITMMRLYHVDIHEYIDYVNSSTVIAILFIAQKKKCLFKHIMTVFKQIRNISKKSGMKKKLTWNGFTDIWSHNNMIIRLIRLLSQDIQLLERRGMLSPPPIARCTLEEQVFFLHSIVNDEHDMSRLND